MGQIIYSPGSGSSTPGNLDIANVDNAGRVEVSSNISTGEYVLDNDNLPLYFDAVNISGGTQSYDATNNSQLLTGGGSGIMIFQTKQRHPYFPGHAQQAEFTFMNFNSQVDVVKRVGYYSSTTTTPHQANLDGIYLEAEDDGVSHSLKIANNGTIVSIPQTSWFDPLDGTGASGITINWSNFQVFMIDFLYLGGTYVNLYYVAEGKRHLIHRYDHANSKFGTIMSNPAQPIRAELQEFGEVGTFRFTCAQVSTQGDNSLFSGIPLGVNTGSSLISASSNGTKYVALVLRKNLRSKEVFINEVAITSTAAVGQAFRWTIEINPTLSGALTYGAVANTGLDLAQGGGVTVTSPGHVIATGNGASRGSASIAGISKGLRVGQTIAGVYDRLVLTYTPLSSNHDFTAGINLSIV